MARISPIQIDKTPPALKAAFERHVAEYKGRATALALAQEGVHIIGFDIARQQAYPGYTLGSADELEPLRAEIEQAGGQALGFQGDVRNDADITLAIEGGLAALEGLTPKQVAERSAGNLLPVPWVEAEDVAKAVIFLASDDARFITGSQFVLDAELLTR